MINIENLTKKYGTHKAVDNLNLNIKAGEIYGFLGPNGAGKTTTIKMLAGAIAPTSGRITLAGFDLAKNPKEAKSLVGYIPDRPFLYEKLSGLEFMNFISDLYQINKKDFNERSVKLLQLFELFQWKNELIESYSHGMKQRLIMAAALLIKPKILIVDEPMVGLDPRGAKLVIDIFRHLADNENLAILVSTHTMALASRLCDRIGIIAKGKMVASGTEEDLKKQSGQDGELEEIFLKLTGGDNPQIITESL